MRGAVSLPDFLRLCRSAHRFSRAACRASALPTELQPRGKKSYNRLPPLHRDDLDGGGDALQGNGPGVGAREGTPGGLDGSRAGHDLLSTGQRTDAGRLVHAFPQVVVPMAGCLSDVHADANLGSEPRAAPMLGQLALDLHCADERTLGALECNEEPVPSVLHLLATVAVEAHPEGLVVPTNQIRPGLVPDCFHQVG